MNKHRVSVQSASSNPEDVANAIERGLAAVDRLPKSGERWVVKLNLTYPTYIPGVVNSPVFIEGFSKWGSARGIQIAFIEGDGGNGAYSAQNAFDGNGVSAIAKRYGMRCLSINQKPWRFRETSVLNKTVRLPYAPFFDERQFDRFISTPLFKNHIFTTVSLGLKNLWGCIPDPYRMYYHWILDHGIVALYKELQPDFTIIDGIVGLKGRGPIDGQPINMNLILAGGDCPAAEIAALRLMDVPLKKVKHLMLAKREGLLPEESEIAWTTEPMVRPQSDFVINRTVLDYLSIGLSKHPRLQRRIYHSSLSKIVYKAVNFYRGRSPQSQLTKAKFANTYDSIPFSEH
jgi:uncharacterized protein (DUF362 family)